MFITTIFVFHRRKMPFGWVNDRIVIFLVYCSFKTWTLGYKNIVMVSQIMRYQQFIISIRLSYFAMHQPMIELMFVFIKQQTNKRNLPSQPTRKINRIWQLNPWPASPLLKEGINISLAMGNWLCDTFNNIALVLKLEWICSINKLLQTQTNIFLHTQTNTQ